MRVERIIPDLVVNDVQATTDFYSGYLNLTRDDLGIDWITRYVAPSGASLQVLTHDPGARLEPVVSLAVDDVDAAYNEAIRRGYELVHPLTTEAWGVRRFFVRDPDGHVINVLQHRE